MVDEDLTYIVCEYAKTAVSLHRNQKQNIMTLQDLKNNRNEIIERISEIALVSRTSEIMSAMVNLIETGSNESDDAIELVDEVVELFGFDAELLQSTAADRQERNEENLRKQRNMYCK